MKEKQLKIEYLPKESLKTYVNNAKIHTAGQVEAIKKSIDKFGFNDPIAIWKNDEIIEGHGRLLAAMEMDDIETVPVIRLDSLTDKERKAYIIAHNKLTLNTVFDMDLLSEELKDIGEDIDMSELGFDDDELKELLGEIELDDVIERTDLSDTFELAMRVVIECDSESQQKELYDEMVERGLKCKIE